MADHHGDQDVEAITAQRRLDCYQNVSQATPPSAVFCPVLFDGWSCWPVTEAGMTANQSCPDFIPGFERANTVSYKCEQDGSWYFHEAYNKTWVNYTSCVNTADLSFRTIVVSIHCFGYGVSLIALLVSLALLFHFKSLRCVRILIHMNLFASFALNNCLWLLWYYVVFDETAILISNEIWCIALHRVLYTGLISNYSWMLCEGLYLHTVLVWAFIQQSSLYWWMNVVGWGVPLLTTLIYVPVRAWLGEGDELDMCWMRDFRYDFIQQIPVAATVGLFLINIVRVVVLKLRRGPANEPSGGASRSTLQALRATLLLVPLLGLNFLLTPFRPQGGPPWEYVYEIVSAITMSFQVGTLRGGFSFFNPESGRFQGLCVAVLFCFCNGEVQAQIKRKWRAARFRSKRANSCTMTTVSVRKVVPPAYLFTVRAYRCAVKLMDGVFGERAFRFQFVRTSGPQNGEDKV
uniref:G-protein coupled receptors family 2 profile 2 domain-containing protein n=1 Tax=Dendroctonus ponderosae TaxID=77166 RepID=A0AAR5PS78_DENPD